MRNLVVFTLALIVAGFAAAQETIKVGATPVPHAEILEFVAPALEEAGYTLEIIEFTDYVQPNLALDAGDIDANFFQHVPYLESFSSNRGLNLVSVGSVHIEPIGLYSETHSAVRSISNGATIAIPNDPTNGGRALLLLESAGLIQLASGVGLDATPIDVVENPLGLFFIELEAAQLPRALADVDAAVINTNYAIEAGLNPVDDALLIETSDSPYANIVVVRAGDEATPATLALVAALQSEAVSEFILETYEGAVVPAF